MALGYVRPARTDDAGEIARIQLATWRHAYRRIFPRHVLDDIDEEWVLQRWRSSIDDPPSPRHRVLVAVEEARQSYLVGFVAAGEVDEAALAPDEDPATTLRPDVASITDLLVEPRWARRGHGSRLLAACTDTWRRHGFVTALCWAFQQDVAMRAFLTSAGWEPDGVTRGLDVNDMLVAQLRLHTRVG